jgi:hypothetical protein
MRHIYNLMLYHALKKIEWSGEAHGEIAAA